MSGTRPRARLVVSGTALLDEPMLGALGRAVADGALLDLRRCSFAGHAVDLARDAPEGERVIAVGGDGTVREVAHGLAGRSGTSILGIVPRGTANDFARRWADIADPAPWLAAALGPTIPCDLGVVDADTFANVVSIGAPAAISQQTTRELKDRMGALSYVACAASSPDTVAPFSVVLDSLERRWEGTAHAVFVGNGRTVGGGFAVCPDARVDDGLLDVAVVPDMPLAELLMTIGETAALGASERIVRWRTSSLRCVLSRPVPVSLDGEVGVRERFEVRVREGIRLAVPCGLPRESAPPSA